MEPPCRGAEVRSIMTVSRFSWPMLGIWLLPLASVHGHPRTKSRARRRTSTAAEALWCERLPRRQRRRRREGRGLERPKSTPTGRARLGTGREDASRLRLQRSSHHKEGVARHSEPRTGRGSSPRSLGAAAYRWELARLPIDLLHTTGRVGPFGFKPPVSALLGWNSYGTEGAQPLANVRLSGRAKTG